MCREHENVFALQFNIVHSRSATELGGKKIFLIHCVDQTQNASHLTCQQSITTISLLMLAKYCHLQNLFIGGTAEKLTFRNVTFKLFL